MDTRMLEVVMGLVLVLALVSLLTAVMHEAFVAKMGRRGDVLTLALCSLLGENQVKRVWRIRRSDNVNPFSRGLLAHPLLASQVLGPVGNPVKDKGASYLDSRVFVSALLAYGNERAGPGASRPADPAAWVSLLAQPSVHQTPPRKELVDALLAMLGGVEQDWPAFERRLCAWYDSVMDRATGWFQRDTQLRLCVLGLLIAAAGNINPLVIGERLWNDPLVRAVFVDSGAIAQELNAPTAASQPASASATPAATKVNGKASSAKPAPDTPLGAVLDRSLQQLRDDVLVRGEEKVAKAGSSAASELAEVRRVVQRFDNLRDDVQRRRQAWRDGASTEAQLAHSLAREEEYDALRVRLSADTSFAADKRPARLHDLLRYERNQQLRQSGAVAEGLCRQAQGGALEAACKRLEGSERMGLGQLPIGWSFANWPGCDAACQQRVRAAKVSDLQQRLQLESMDDAKLLRATLWAPQAASAASPWSSQVAALSTGDWVRGLIYCVVGFVLIGIGSMLGAPFWFDMLGKVAKMRAAGLAAKAASEAAEAPAPVGVPQAADAGGVLARSGAAAAPAAAPATPALAARAGRVPLYPNNDIHVLSEQQVRDLYGDIRTTETAGVVTLTHPGVGAVQRTLVTLSHPLLKGRTVQVHERARAHFEAAFNAIEAAKLGHLIKTCGGTVAMRHIGNDPNNALSHHCWGIAIDFNEADNGYGVVPAAVGQPGSLRELVPIFNRYGFAWGGHFRSKLDGMHFELALLDPTQPPQPLADA
ncbi:MAG: M15 family metallopeptidase [Roseateles sp.]|uniref:M15 family metallopeptidase n=1 Tax=Roseateles sp. TaxID=1971397 RepID=UPI004036432A